MRAPRLDFPSNVSDPRIRRTSSYNVDYHVERVKHGDIEELGKLIVHFGTPDSVKNFAIDYVIRPANLPEPVRGTLHVLFERDAA